ncbi:MAG: hypothetical protein AABZ00_10345 [Chloroflexota bacterium]
MLHKKRFTMLWVGLLIMAIALTACAKAAPAEPTDLIVKGVSGNEALLDRLWVRGCVPGANGNDWTDAKRTLTGLDLVFVLVDYQNGSDAPDCENGRVGSSAFTVHLTYDNVMVPITWVGPDGKPATAPEGLESVTEANGATALFTNAEVTPETQARADQLNAAAFCEFTDWKPNVTKDVGDCFTGGYNPIKGTIIVDDRSMPWKVYDGAGALFDENGYPIDIPNYLPHEGPFEP